MPRFFRTTSSLFARQGHIGLLLSIALLATSAAHAQFNVPPAGTKVQDTSALHPPAGARVAIVEFSDMECPLCARVNPTLIQAVAQYKIPLVRHDFLIPGHIWSPAASLNARWFDAKSKNLGDDYRTYIFANQRSIYNLNALADFTRTFAQSHGIALPFALDPQGKLQAELNADNDLGRRIGIQHTPTIFIVTANSKGAPFIEVQNPDQDLYRIIDQALADTAAVKPPPAKKPGASPHKSVKK